MGWVGAEHAAGSCAVGVRRWRRQAKAQAVAQVRGNRRGLLVFFEETEGMPGWVKHDPDAGRIAIGWLP